MTGGQPFTATQSGQGESRFRVHDRFSLCWPRPSLEALRGIRRVNFAIGRATLEPFAEQGRFLDIFKRLVQDHSVVAASRFNLARPHALALNAENCSQSIGKRLIANVTIQ